MPDVVVASFDISPLWADPTALYVHVNAPLGADTSETIGVRAAKLATFVESVLTGVGLSQQPPVLPGGTGP